MRDPLFFTHLQRALTNPQESLTEITPRTWENYLRSHGWGPEQGGGGWWVREGAHRLPLGAEPGHPVWNHTLRWVAATLEKDPALVLAELLQEESKNGPP